MDNEIRALNIIFTEFYYWVTIVFMFLIHVGFCLYEVGVSRQKHILNTLLKNVMLIPLVTLTFFLFGWWIYFAFPNGPGVTGGLKAAPWAVPWSELMGTHLGGSVMSDGLSPATAAEWARVNGVFWAAFLLFSWTAASIVSGAVIERIRTGSFLLFAVLVGSVTWVLDAAWGWSGDGWMVTQLGYHDAYASGVIHALAGGSALAILIHLGPRIGRFRPDGSARVFPPHNEWMVAIGLLLIYTGFWGFYAACNIPIFNIGTGGEAPVFSAVTIYLTPTTLSAITFNFLLSLAGGMMVGYIVSGRSPFWTLSAGLAGVITASAGNDLYHPMQALLIGGLGAGCSYFLHNWVERRFRIDDAVGAVAVHGYAGVLGVVICGFMLWGYPATPNADSAVITPWGQTAGALIIFAGLGFLPCYALGWLLKRINLLRIPPEVELVGLDFHEQEDRRILAQEIQEAELKGAGKLK